MHTTCGMYINENADPDLVRDFHARLEKYIPRYDTHDLHREGNTAAHLRSMFLGSSVTVPVQEGGLVLGVWQGIYMGEFDGPRTRKICVTSLKIR